MKMPAAAPTRPPTITNCQTLATKSRLAVAPAPSRAASTFNGRRPIRSASTPVGTASRKMAAPITAINSAVTPAGLAILSLSAMKYWAKPCKAKKPAISRPRPISSRP